MNRPQHPCPECLPRIDRRSFLRTASTGVAAAGAAAWLSPFVHAAPGKNDAAETAVAELYNTLSESQRSKICLPFDHPLRSRISANWHVTDVTIGSDFYTKEQQGLIREIVKGLSSEDGFERLIKQMDYDDGGLEFYSAAIFGEPKSGKFEFELTGRHLTLRADGDSVDKAAFGGPIVYGHGEEAPKDNLYHYQTKQVNEVFRALDADQAKQALQSRAPRETAVQVQGPGASFPGIAVGSLKDDQKQLVEGTLKVLLAPHREADRDEVMQIVKENGGVDALHMAFYEQGDLNNDKVWDIWRIEGPAFVWHFRGAPHVHAYINIGAARKS